MPLFSKTAKQSTRLFFATDVHGSERTFRKFINAGKFYQAAVRPAVELDVTASFR